MIICTRHVFHFEFQSARAESAAPHSARLNLRHMHTKVAHQKVTQHCKVGNNVLVEKFVFGGDRSIETQFDYSRGVHVGSNLTNEVYGGVQR